MRQIEELQLSAQEISVSVSDAAAQRVREIAQAENRSSCLLRVYVEGGGCSGLQYGFSLEEQAGPDDTHIHQAGITLLVDSMSLPFLQGATIDFQQNLMGAQFVVSNPNAQTTCGCGSSFEPDLAHCHGASQ